MVISTCDWYVVGSATYAPAEATRDKTTAANTTRQRLANSPINLPSTRSSPLNRKPAVARYPRPCNVPRVTPPHLAVQLRAYDIFAIRQPAVSLDRPPHS